MADNTYTTTQAPWSAQIPYLQQAFGAAQGLYNQGPQQYYPGSTIAPLGQWTNQGLQSLKGLGDWIGNTANNPANSYANNVLRGDYLNSNPYLDKTFDRAADAVSRQFSQATLPGINAAFSMSGRTGSGAHQNAADWASQAYGRNLSDLATNIYGGNYAQERQNQQGVFSQFPALTNMNLQGAQASLGAGSIQDTQAQKELSDQVARFNFGQEAPYNALQQYLAAIGGGYGGQTTKPLYQPSTASQVIGGLTTGVGLLSQLGII